MATRAVAEAIRRESNNLGFKRPESGAGLGWVSGVFIGWILLCCYGWLLGSMRMDWVFVGQPRRPRNIRFPLRGDGLPNIPDDGWPSDRALVSARVTELPATGFAFLRFIRIGNTPQKNRGRQEKSRRRSVKIRIQHRKLQIISVLWPKKVVFTVGESRKGQSKGSVGPVSASAGGCMRGC